MSSIEREQQLILLCFREAISVLQWKYEDTIEHYPNFPVCHRYTKEVKVLTSPNYPFSYVEREMVLVFSGGYHDVQVSWSQAGHGADFILHEENARIRNTTEAIYQLQRSIIARNYDTNSYIYSHICISFCSRGASETSTTDDSMSL